MNILRSAAAAALLCPSALLAQEPPVLEPVVVTATGHEMPVREALASVVVITREELARSLATDVAEVLRFHAGVELGRNGGPGAITSVFTRGGESNHTLVLVNGVRLNPATSGGAALQNISPDMVERIEIVKGPRATLYGSDAISSVINIITRGAPTSALQGQLRTGADNTRDASALLARSNGTQGVSLNVERLITDGMPPVVGFTTDRGYERSSATISGQAEFGPLALTADVLGSQSNTEYLGFGGSLNDQDQKNHVAAVGAAWSWSPQLQSRLSASYMLDDIRQNQSTDFVRTERPGLALHNTWSPADGSRLSFGVDAAREKVDALFFDSRIVENRDVYGVFVQNELAIGRHRALVASRLTDHDAFGKEGNWNAEYGYDLTPDARLIAAAGTGFRAPDATDRFGFGGNPNLDPERARNYELGLRQFFGEGRSFEVRAFRTTVKDLISVECVANCADLFNAEFRAINIDRFRNRGVELSYRLTRSDWSAHASLLRQNPESENRPDACSGEERVCRRATKTATAGVVRRLANFYLGADILGSDERLDFGGTRLPGYALVNLSGGVEFARQWRLAARVENILDADYQTAAGYNQPGASAYLTLGWQM